MKLSEADIKSFTEEKNKAKIKKKASYNLKYYYSRSSLQVKNNREKMEDISATELQELTVT